MIKITATTIIVSDVDLLNWCIYNAHRRAGLMEGYELEWLIILADARENTIGYCEEIQKMVPEMNLKYVVHKEKTEKQIPDKTQRFLHNLYACWNMGYEHADSEWVVRMGSDQYFSRQWLYYLMRAAENYGKEYVYHCLTVESPAAVHSRHPIMNYGTTWQDFDERRWDQYCNDVQHRYSSIIVHTPVQAGLYHSHPTRGTQLRPDGVTWLQAKEVWEKHGPMSDDINEEGVTGDVSYMDKLYDNGIAGLQVPCSLSYHLVRGESRDVQE